MVGVKEGEWCTETPEIELSNGAPPEQLVSVAKKLRACPRGACALGWLPSCAADGDEIEVKYPTSDESLEGRKHSASACMAL